MKTPRAWYRFQNVAEDATVAEIHIIDFIGDWIDDYWGFGVTAKAFIETLANLPAAVTTIRVRINSPGGDVFGAVNIANALREQQASKGRTVETIVDGLAASAASIILMAGSKVSVADNALVMIHDPWSVGVGNASDMRKVADTLDTVRNTIVATYKWHSSLSEAEIVDLMAAETWMDADAAIEKGFATDKVAGLKAAASIDPLALDKLKVPDRFKDRVKAFIQPTPATPTPAAALEVVKACKAAGCSEIADELLAENLTTEQVQTRITAAKDRKTAAAQRASAITTLCSTAKLPGLSSGYIAGAMTVDAVKAQLTIITANNDKVEIDTNIRNAHNPTRGAVDRVAIYKNFNKR